MKDLLLLVAVVIGSIITSVLVTGIFMIILYPVGYSYCNDYGVMSGLATKYKGLTLECYVKHNGVWIEKDKLIGVHDVSR